MTTMPPPSVPRCVVCRHPSRAAIEQEAHVVLNGESVDRAALQVFATIAARFGVTSATALRRHLDEHPTASPREPADEAKALARAIDRPSVPVALLMIDALKPHSGALNVVLALLRRLAFRDPDRLARSLPQIISDSSRRTARRRKAP